ncbi:MAG: 16S rRNA (adenine(1518)-N(6)/adenine(1519)-N(6))-dimethyltransferase RsmA [Chloroflexi bacterium]|nr:16S rRNA (adenine(1518)-N(6)/adenine(1519)-N(6))-dimethyltransferase RsmA [Chloroflexota bacterium]
MSSATRQFSARPRKSLGQHFLVDGRVLTRIVASADLNEADIVVEVGPGKGALTRRLLPRVAQVIAIEMDENLAEALPAKLDSPPNLSVVCGDARAIDFGSTTGFGQPYKVVANLPYYAANPIIRRFLETEPRPSSLVVMVQREVAESMTAHPGKMTLLSVATQFYANARTVCQVPPSAFRPAPKVTSTVVRLDLSHSLPLEECDISGFFDLVRAGFSAPRKQLRNSLGHGLRKSSQEIMQLLEAAGIDGARRAETLELKEWLETYRQWKRSGHLLSREQVQVC